MEKTATLRLPEQDGRKCAWERLIRAGAVCRHEADVVIERPGSEWAICSYHLARAVDRLLR